VRREAQELRILYHASAVGAVILDDHRLQLVEQQLVRHATEEPKRRLEALTQHLHGLARIKLQPQVARVAQHHDESVAFPPRHPTLCKIHLRLLPRRRLKPHDPLHRRRRPNLAHERL
jgi:hypothetical protein